MKLLTVIVAATLTLLPASGLRASIENAFPGTNRDFGKSLDAHPDPVAASSGGFYFTRPLLDLGGPAGLGFSLTYRSKLNRPLIWRDQIDFSERFWWNPHFTAHRARSGSYFYLTVQGAGGNLAAFRRETAGGEWSLVKDGDLVGMEWPDNSSAVGYRLEESTYYYYLFDPPAAQVLTMEKLPREIEPRPVRIQDRYLNGLEFLYEGPNDVLPHRIEDGRGRRLDFEYGLLWTGQTGLVRVSDQAGREVSFAFDTGADNLGEWTLRSLTDPEGLTTTYYYGSFSWYYDLISEVRHPRGSAFTTQSYGEAVLDGLEDARVIEQRDAYGHLVAFSYDSEATRLTTTWPDGAEVGFEHRYHHGMPLGNTDGLGNFTAFSRNDRERMTGITDRFGRESVFTYLDETGQPASAVNRLGRELAFTYQASFQVFTNPHHGEWTGFTFYDLARIDHPDGSSESFTRDGRGGLVGYRDRNGEDWAFTRADDGRLLTATNPVSGTATFTYNADGTVATATDSDTGVIAFGYDESLRLNRVTRPDASFVQMTYDRNDRLTAWSDETGRTTLFEYDPNGNLVGVTDAAFNRATFGYDLMDRPVSRTDRRGKVSTFAYDNMGRLQAAANPAGDTVSFAYDLAGNLVQLTDGEGKEWGYGWDAEGLFTSLTGPLGSSWTTIRDELGRVGSVTDPLGGSAVFLRDNVGRVISAADRLGRATLYSYDGRGALTGVELPDGASAAYGYDGAGSLVTVTDPGGNRWDLGRSPMGRFTGLTDPLGNAWACSYDDRGRPSVLTYPDGGTLTFTYDAAGNLTGAAHSGEAGLAFTYDALDRLTSADGFELAYDPEGRVVSTANPPVAFNAAYDDAGRLASVTYLTDTGSFTVTYGYDRRGLLTSVSDDLTGTALALARDDAGRLTAVERPGDALDTLYTYDDADRLTRIREGAVSDLQYTCNAAGEVTEVVYGLPLDPAGFFAAQTESFSFDAASQVSSDGYYYDLRGRRTADPGRSFAWDGASRLAATGWSEMSYNALGGLRSRTAGGETTAYFYNFALAGRPIVAERDEGTGDFRRYYVWSPSGELLYLIEPADGNRVLHYHFDRIGNTVFLSDADGEVTDAYAYDPYGRLLDQTGSSGQPFTFSGRWGVRREDDAGTLYQAGVRYYDAVTANFLSREPLWPLILQPRALNPYQYAAANPISYVDPTGYSFLQALDYMRSLWGVADFSHLFVEDGTSAGRCYRSGRKGITGAYWKKSPLESRRRGREGLPLDEGNVELNSEVPLGLSGFGFAPAITPEVLDLLAGQDPPPHPDLPQKRQGEVEPLLVPDPAAYYADLVGHHLGPGKSVEMGLDNLARFLLKMGDFWGTRYNVQKYEYTPSQQ